jgi:carbon storage regulator CsrA
MALVLTRRNNESLIFMREGEPDIKVTIIGLQRHGNTLACRIAIHAPDNVDVVREELLYRNDKWRGRESHGQEPVRD